MTNILLLLSLSISVVLCALMIGVYRQLKKAMRREAEARACLDYLKDKIHDIDELVKDTAERNKHQIAMVKFILSNTRLDLMAHLDASISQEAYENANKLRKAISLIEDLLKLD